VGRWSDALRHANRGSLRPDIAWLVRECVVPYAVDFDTVSTVGLESSPVAAALAGLRANEARYFKNKYDHVFTLEPASAAKATIDWVHRILKEERDIVIAARPLKATTLQVENIRMAYAFSRFKFARQKSKLAGTIRGSYFNVQNEY
jgi:hypothetical protein